MSGKIDRLRQAKKFRNATSRSSGRRANDAYRVREHLTEAEMDKLLDALKRNRHGHRDWLIGLIIYRHGLRVSEACDLRWDDIDLPKRTIIVRRLKGSTDSVHYLERDELNGLKLLHRQQQADGIKAAYVFINERGQPFGRMGIGRMIRAGRGKPLDCRSRSMSTCCGIRLDTHWRPGEWTHGGSSTSSAMPRSPTPCATPPCRRSRSRTSGGAPEGDEINEKRNQWMEGLNSSYSFNSLRCHGTGARPQSTGDRRYTRGGNLVCDAGYARLGTTVMGRYGPGPWPSLILQLR
jgi:Phage integrase family